MINIKEAVKEIFTEKSTDGITFLPESDFNLSIRGFSYTKKSKYEKNSLGHVYHIMLYKCDENGFVVKPDNFTAVLTDPYVYVSSVIECGFYGVVVKKTRASTKFVNEIYKSILAYQNGKEIKTQS